MLTVSDRQSAEPSTGRHTIPPSGEAGIASWNLSRAASASATGLGRGFAGVCGFVERFCGGCGGLVWWGWGAVRPVRSPLRYDRPGQTAERGLGLGREGGVVVVGGKRAGRSSLR